MQQRSQAPQAGGKISDTGHMILKAVLIDIGGAGGHYLILLNHILHALAQWNSSRQIVVVFANFWFHFILHLDTR